MSQLSSVFKRQQKVDKSNIDRSINDQKAYELLVRQQEAKDWIEDLTEQKLAFETADLMQGLKDGVVLCQLAQSFAPGSVTKIHKPKIGSVLEFMATDNYNQFFRACEKVFFPPIYMFSVPELWEKKNVFKIVHCLHCLAHYLFRKGIVTKRIKKITEKIEFSQEDIEKTKQLLASVKEEFSFSAFVDEEEPEPAPPQEEEDVEADDKDTQPPEPDEELADPDKCLISKGEFKKGRCGELVTFTLQARDANNNDIKIGGETFDVQLTRKGDGLKITPKIHDNENGSYDVSYTAEKAGDYQMEVSLVDYIDDDDKPDYLPVTSACTLVKIEPAPTDASKSIVSGLGAESAIAGILASFTLETFDKFGNKSQHDQITAKLVHETKANVSIDVTVKEEVEQPGTYQLSYTCPFIGPYSLSINIGDTPVFSQAKTVTVKDAGVSDPTHSFVELPQDLLPTSNDGRGARVKAGQNIAFTIQATDKHGNLRQSGGENFQVELKSKSNPSQTVKLNVIDTNDGKYSVSHLITVSDDYEIVVSLNDTPISGSPVPIVVTDSGITDSSKCTYKLMDGQLNQTSIQDNIKAGQVRNILVEPRDQFGNKRQKLNDGETFVLVVVSKGRKEQVAQVESSAKDYNSQNEKDAALKLPFTLNEADSYSLEVLYEDKSKSPDQMEHSTIPGFPCEIKIIENGKSNPIKTKFEGEGLTRAVSNQPSSFTIITHDTFGNRRHGGGDTVKVVLVNQKRNVTFTAEVTDLEDGTYEVNYLPTTSGNYNVLVTLNGESVYTEQLVKDEANLFVEAPYVKKITKEDLESIYDHDLLSSLMNSFIVEQDNENLIEEIQKVREQLVKQIRTNTQVEAEVKDLDRKIQLLINNRLKVDQVFSTSRGGLFGLFGRKPQKTSQEGTSLDTPVKDRNKLDAYSKLFYLLQTDPRYLSSLLYLVPADKVDKFLETVILTLYGYAFSPREEFLILSLFKLTLQLEISKAKKLGSFLNNNPVLPKMVMTYGRRVQGKQFLQKVLFDKVLTNILGDKDLNLELNAVKLLKDHISREEVRTGVKSKINLRDLTFEKAMEDETVSKMVNERVDKLTELCQIVLNGIIEHVNDLPYGLRWVCKQLDFFLKQKHPDSSESERASVIGYIAYYRFMNPAIVSPDYFGLTKKNQKISMNMRNNLVAISRVLTNLANNVLFDPKIEAQMTVMNEWIKKNQQVYVEKFICELIKVGEPEETLGVHQFMELTQKKNPSISITWNEIFSTHGLLVKYATKLTTDKDDPLKKILDVLGEQVPEELPQEKNEEINLPLIPNISKDAVDKAQDVNPEQLYEQTKHNLRFILRTLPTDALGENLEETLVKAKALAQDKLKNAPSVNLQQVKQTDLSKLSEVERAALTLDKIKSVEEALPKLEQEQIISRANHFRKVLVDITEEIQNQKVIREKQKKELERLKESLKSLEDHHKYLKDRIVQFEEYIEDCRRKQFQGSSHGSSSASSTSVVSRKKKYTYKQLKDKGVIVELNVMKSQLSKISFVISMTSPGVFAVEAKLLGMTVKTITLVLDELLDYQSKSRPSIQFDNVTLDVNLTLHLLNKLFAAKN